MKRTIRMIAIYLALATTLFGFYDVARPILFFVGLAWLVAIGESIWFHNNSPFLTD